MRLGQKRTGSSKPSAPETTTVLTVAQYLDLCAASPADASQVRTPFSGGKEAATAALFPALVGRRPVETIVSSAALGAYTLALDGYGVLPFWKNATWDQRVNQPDKFTFDYPADADHATRLTRPGIVWLYDANGQLVQIFRLLDLLPSVKRDASGISVQVKAESSLGLLADEWVSYYGPIRQRPKELVEDYRTWRDGAARTTLDKAHKLTDAFSQLLEWSAGYSITDKTHVAFKALVATWNATWITWGADEASTSVSAAADSLVESLHLEIVAQAKTDTVPNHVKSLLEQFQVSSSISAGPMFDALDETSVTPKFEAKSLLDCITELHKLCGQLGFFTVTPDNEFVWLPSLGTDGTTVSLGYNLRSVERHCDTSEVCTVLTVYGQGLSPDSRMSSSASNNVDIYGRIPRQMWVDQATTQADLDTYATALVAALSVPIVDYNVSAADLHSIGLGPLITLGSFIQIFDTDLGIESQQWLVGITRKLDNPLDVTFQFAKHTRDLPAIVRAIQARLDTLERRDDLSRIQSAIRDGKLPGVRDGYHIAGEPRQTDLRVDDGRLQYNDGKDWQTVPSHDPSYASPGDSRVNPAGDLQHYDGEAWAGPGSEIQPVGAEIAEGDSKNYARSNHVHSGVVPPEKVRKLPPIPDSGVLYVIWQSATTAPRDISVNPPIEAGTGDDHMWSATEYDDEWTCCFYYSDLSGVPA